MVCDDIYPGPEDQGVSKEVEPIGFNRGLVVTGPDENLFLAARNLQTPQFVRWVFKSCGTCAQREGYSDIAGCEAT